MFGRPPLSKAPLLIPAVTVVCGAWLGCSAPWWCAVFILLVALLFLALHHHYLASVMCISLAAFASAWFQNPRTCTLPVNSHLTCSATVQEINSTNTGSALRLKIDSIGTSDTSLKPIQTARAVAYTTILPNEIERGERIVFSAKFQPCTVKHDLPLETDPNDYLLHRRIFIYTLLSPSSIHKRYPPSGLSGRLASELNRFREGLFTSDLSNRNISFLNTITTGDTSTLLPSDRKIFSNAGLAHILALSGMHVGLIAWIIAIAFWPLKFSGKVWPTTIATLLFLWAYAIGTGMSPSVMRSVIMATFFSIAYLSFRQRSGLNALCGAVIVILIIWPDSLFSIGFQMSVSAVTSIILFADILNPVPENLKNQRKLFTLLTVPVAAMLGTSVIVAFYFHSLPLYFIFSNIASSILLLPTMICAIAISIASIFGLHPLWLSDVTSWLCNSIFNIAEFFSSLPGSTMSGIWIPATAILPALIAILLFRLWLEYKTPAWLTASALISLSTALIIIFSPRPEQIKGILLPSTLKSTAIIFTNPAAKALSLYSLASSNFKEDLSRLAEIRYSEYTVASRLDSIHVATTTSPVQFLDSLSAHCNASVALLTPDTLIANSNSPQILFITSSAKRQHLDSIPLHTINSVIISAAVPPASAMRIENYFTAKSLPVKYIRRTPHFFENP